MKHKLRRLFLHTLQNTPLEDFARSVYTFVVQGKEAKYHTEMKRIMAKVLRKNSNCIDVGAYRGEILGEMTKFTPTGTIFGFEPIPENYMYISKRYKKAVIYNLALSDKPGQARFFYPLGRPARSSLVRQAYPDPHERVEIMTVDVETLDSVIPENVKIDFIKMDVEGAELNVFRGGERLIRRDHPIIVFEHALDMAARFGTTSEELYDFLTDHCCLRVSLMQRWLESQPAFSRDDFVRIVHARDELCFIAS